MEAWELKAGLEVILGSAHRALTLSDLARGLGVDERAAEDAVSYTHLDVYKRQFENGTPRRHAAFDHE